MKSKIKSRNGLTLFTWAIGLILIIVLGVLSALFDRKSMLALLIVIVFICKYSNAKPFQTLASINPDK